MSEKTWRTEYYDDPDYGSLPQAIVDQDGNRVLECCAKDASEYWLAVDERDFALMAAAPLLFRACQLFAKERDSLPDYDAMDFDAINDAVNHALAIVGEHQPREGEA